MATKTTCEPHPHPVRHPQPLRPTPKQLTSRLPPASAPQDLFYDESSHHSQDCSSPAEAADLPIEDSSRDNSGEEREGTGEGRGGKGEGRGGTGEGRKGAVLATDGYYQEVEEQDWDIYVRNLTRSRIYSVMLVNEWGKIIYSDKTGNELFEGSLNNFGRLHIQNLIVASLLPRLLPKLRLFSSRTPTQILKMLVYSKNAKRRYSRCEIKNPKDEDEIFFRFLKSITCRIRPCAITFRDYAQF